MENYFYLDDSPVYKDKMIIRLHMDKLPFPTGTEGSYNVFPARLMNLSYADYLRYCRDRVGAELIGKNNKYVVPYFDDTQTVRGLVKLLNKRLEYVMLEQEYPFDYIKKEDGTIERIPFNTDDNNETDSGAV